MADPAPPPEVAFAFLGTLNQTVDEFEENLVPVLRGSLLMRHWFGDEARPAADLDLECFQRPRALTHSEEEEQYRGDGYGEYGEFESLVDFGKAMCRYAANQTQGYQWRDTEVQPEVEFREAGAPKGGVSLWTYGTPGERYFAGWVWHAEGARTGRLQIDIAAAGYNLTDIATAPIKLTAANGANVKCPAYTPETLLAAKLSWLMRSLRRDGDAIEWKGEPKDLFDAHLLLTQAKLKLEPFQKSLLAIGAQDGLEWNTLDTLLSLRHSATDDDFPNWEAFRKKHADLVGDDPAEMLRTIADCLEPLLGDFYRRDEMPFLRTINANPSDELAYLVYADWLDENGHTDRGSVLRLFAEFEFHPERPAKHREENRSALLALLLDASRPWLFQLFGTATRLNEVMRRVEEPKK